MASGTLFFNSTLYRKTMARFWPLWVLYGLFWLFAIPLNLLNRYFDRLRWSGELNDAQADLLDLAQDIPGILVGGVSLSLVFGLLCAMAVFGYLYNNRSAGMMHTLPLRREALFFTQYLAGLSFFLLPHLAVGLLGAAVELALLPAAGWGPALSALGTWLLAQSGTCLFFFSFAAFCAMFTGHILALPAFYSILNCLVLVIHTLVTELLYQFFYGLTRSALPALVEYCTPAYMLAEACWMSRVTLDPVTGDVIRQHLDSPLTIAAYAGIGVVLAVLALLVYRRRHVESAGDVVSIPLVRPIFQVGVSFCAGLTFGILTAVFFGWSSDAIPLALCVLAWSAVGYFAAEMLLKKSFRVFRAWKGCLAMLAAMAVLCAACLFDWFGLEGRVPTAGEVSSLYVSGSTTLPYDDGYSNWGEITDPEQIQQFISLHQAIIREKDRALHGGRYEYQSAAAHHYLRLSYTLQDGSTLDRQYRSVPLYPDDLEKEGTATYCFNRLVQDRALTEQCYGFDHYEENGRLVEAYLDQVRELETGEVDNLYFEDASRAQLEALWQAVRSDFDEGTIGVRYLFNDADYWTNTYGTRLYFSFEMPSRRGESYAGHGYAAPAPTLEGETQPDSESIPISTLCIALTPNARHTLAALEALGFPSGEYGFDPLEEYEEFLLGASSQAELLPSGIAF